MRGGQRPFGTFPKIHPFWYRRHPSLTSSITWSSMLDDVVQVELEHKLARVEVERLKNEKVIMSSFLVFLTFNSSTWILKVQVYGIQLFMGSSKTSIFSDPSRERGLRGCQEVRPARAGAQNDQGWGDQVKPDLLSKNLPFFTFTFLRWKNIGSERRDCWPTIPSWRRRMWRFKSRFSQLICFNLNETETSFLRPGVEPAKHHGGVWGSEARDPPLARGSWSPQLAGWWCLGQSMTRLASECFVR